MEEYEPYVAGNIIYAGVDYADILAAENDPDGCDVFYGQEIMISHSMSQI